MSGEVVHVEAEVPPERKRHKVYRHPDCVRIEALLRRGKSGFWVALWLEEVYPVAEEPEDDDEKAESERNSKLLISAKELDGYRDKWMPEAAPGVDVVIDQIDDIVGRRFPASTRGKEFELDLLDMAVDVSQHMLGQALEQDDKLKMGVSEVTLAAHEQLLKTIKASAELKSQLGVEGYEPPVDRHQFEHTTKNLNVNLHGAYNARTGEFGPADRARVDAVLGLLSAAPDRAAEVLESTVIENDGDTALGADQDSGS